MHNIIAKSTRQPASSFGSDQDQKPDNNLDLPKPKSVSQN